MSQQASIYERIGGSATIRQIVQVFYGKVFKHPLLRDFFQNEMKHIVEKQYLFLTKYLGGPSLYPEDISPPALRKRHLEFKITKEVANAWLDCMALTLDEVGIQGPVRDEMWARLEAAAYHMVNTESSVRKIYFYNYGN